MTPRFSKALALAEELHRGQVRKGGTIPYIAHLLSVCALVLEHGGSEDEAIAALLHDAVEDQGGKPTLERIRLEFGENVAAIVDGCSDTDVVPKPPWRARKERYVAHLASATASVQLVSACDKLHNARSIADDCARVGSDVWRRFSGGREGSLWYYRAVAGAYGRIPVELRRKLDEAVARLG